MNIRKDFIISGSPYPDPPENLQALCALAGIKWRAVTGRPGHAWELSLRSASIHATRGYVTFARVIQSTEYEDWRDMCAALLEQREKHDSGC